MPRFYFDLLDDAGKHFDVTGLELEDLEAVQQVLEMTLPRISAERAIGSGSNMTLVMAVRDSSDREIVHATLDWNIKIRRDNRDRRTGLPNGEH